MNQSLDQESIINILGIQSLPDERKVELLEQATDLVQKRLLVRILQSLDEVKRTELESLMEQADQGKIDQFLSANVPSFSQWTAEEITKLKEELGHLAGKIE